MGCKPIHVMTAEERKKMVQISEYFVDTGLPVDRVKELVEIGSPITRERTLIEMGECVNSKSIDNRVSVYILIEALKALKDVSIPYDLVAAFTVQEEVGLRGAIASSSGVNPDFGILYIPFIKYVFMLDDDSENKILAFWEKNKVYEKLNQTEKNSASKWN